MTCRKICADCTCGRAVKARSFPANGDFKPTERPAKINRQDFRKAAAEAAVRYKGSMQILA